MYFKIYRDGDSWRLRKVVIELYNWDNTLLDRRRTFAFPLVWFTWRLNFWKGRMLKCAGMMLTAMQETE